MGGKKSKHALHAPHAPPAPLLDEPWRTINWGYEKNNRQYVDNYKPKKDPLRILLHGQVGAGKSSFINSVKSVLQGRMCQLAAAGNVTSDSVTKKYTTYKIQHRDQSTCYPFVINDMVGLKGSRGARRNHLKDVELILKGHVKDGYTFNPECKLSNKDQYYNVSPTIEDKVHVLAYVVDANNASLIDEETVNTMLDVREEAIELGIPQVAILTKIDEACPEIKRNLINVYKSRILREKMKEFSATVGIPMNCIFPVKNYHEETEVNNDIETLILYALKHIIDYGNEFQHSMHDVDSTQTPEMKKPYA